METGAPANFGGVTEAVSSGHDPDRFYCPFPGCTRSFAELWRLKVHYRAPPDIRGSGKERGHGTELASCPRCGKALKPGKHHVGCSGGKVASKQSNKRMKQMLESDSQPSKCKNSQDRVKLEECEHANVLIPMPSHLSIKAEEPSHLPWAQQPPMHPSCPPPPGPSYMPPPHQHPGMHPSMPPWGHPGSVPLPPYPPHPGMSLPPYMPPHPAHPTPFPQHQPPPPHPYPMHPMSYPPPYMPRPPSMNDLSTVFDDVEEGGTSSIPERIPSPPPLPADFHPSAVLFNFSQFTHKLPHTQPQHIHHQKLTSAMNAAGVDVSTCDVIYEHTDEGEIMQLLFGLPDELPTMATTHVHEWGHLADLQDDDPPYMQQPVPTPVHASNMLSPPTPIEPPSSTPVGEECLVPSTVGEPQWVHSKDEALQWASPAPAAGAGLVPENSSLDDLQLLPASSPCNMTSLQPLLLSNMPSACQSPALPNENTSDTLQPVLSNLKRGIDKLRYIGGSPDIRDQLMDSETCSLLQSCE